MMKKSQMKKNPQMKKKLYRETARPIERTPHIINIE